MGLLGGQVWNFLTDWRGAGTTPEQQQKVAGVPHLQEEEVLQVLQQYQEQEQEKYQHQEPENRYQHQEDQEQYRDPAHNAMETYVSTFDPD